MRIASSTWTATRFPMAWVNVFFCLVGLVTLVVGFLATRTARSWTLGQWLISYEGGFIRRGFPGEAFYLLGKLFHVTPVAFVLLTCFVCYAILFVSVRHLASASSRNIWLIALLFSPATFWFQILHPHNGFNKEILYLVSLAIFAVFIEIFLKNGFLASLYLSVMIVLVVLSHEGMIFYEPYFFALIVIGGTTPRRAAKICFVPALLGLAAAYLCSKHSGTIETAIQICSSLGYKFDLGGNSQICAGGAIAYLTRSTAFARADTLGSIRQYHFLLVFPIFAALALVPAAAESLLMFRSSMKREIVVLWATVTISFLGTLALFYFAYDWNRWVYIHVTSIAILLLALDCKVQRDAKTVDDLNHAMTAKQQIGWGAVLVTYAVLCILPNAIQAVRLGFLNRLTRNRHALSMVVSKGSEMSTVRPSVSHE